MNSFRTLFGFNNQLIQYLRQNPLNCIAERQDNKGALFVGNIYAAYNIDILKKHDITAVLTVAAGTGLKYKEEHQLQHMIILADDIEHFNLAKHFDKMIEFIHANRLEGRNILIHCFAGISRSSTACISYMMQEMGYTYKNALALAQQKRKEINPNNGFKRQLQQFENKLKSSADNKNSQNTTTIQNQNQNSLTTSSTFTVKQQRAVSNNAKDQKFGNSEVVGNGFKKTTPLTDNKSKQQPVQNQIQSPEAILSQHKGINASSNKLNSNDKDQFEQLPVSFENNQKQDEQQDDIISNPKSPDEECKTPSKKHEEKTALKQNQYSNQNGAKGLQSKAGLQMSPDKLLYIKNYSQGSQNNKIQKINSAISGNNSNQDLKKGPQQRQLQYKKIN